MAPRIIRSHRYPCSNGTLVFTKEKLYPDGYRLWHPGKNNERIYGMQNTSWLLYGLDRLPEAKAQDKWISFHEGEHDCDCMANLGYVSTTTPCGAGKTDFPDEFWEPLRGAKVFIVGDRDEPGRRYVAAIANRLTPIVAKLRVYEVPPPHKDVADLLEGGGSLKELVPFEWQAHTVVAQEPDGRDPEIRVMTMEELMATPDIADHDKLLEHLILRKSRFIIGAYTGEGKALDTETPIPTPQGWRKMGDLQVGDWVYGADGRPTQVIGTSAVQQNRRCFEVTFSDGAAVVADAEHRWTVMDHSARLSAVSRHRRTASPPRHQEFSRDQSSRWKLPTVLTTTAIRDRLQAGERPVSIPCAAPVDRPAAELLVDPYVLGVWLGDGDTAGSCITAHIDDAGHHVAQFAFAGETVGDLRSDPRNPSTISFRWGIKPQANRLFDVGEGGLKQWAPPMGFQTGNERLRKLELLGNKHIPQAYLEAATSQRLALLQGLVDSDGYVSRNGQVVYTSKLESLANDVYDLALSLGLRAVLRRKQKNVKYLDRSYTSWDVIWKSSLPVARLPRKVQLLPKSTTHRMSHRYIVAIHEVPSRPVKCIAVDAPDHLYLAGRQYIATHNTTMALQILRTILRGDDFLGWSGLGNGTRALVIDVEQGRRTVKRRFVEAHLNEYPDQVRLVWVPDGLALDQNAQHVRQLERILANGLDGKPWDVVIADPLYKLHQGNPNDERKAVDLMRQFDRWREALGFALFLPMHCRKPQPGVKFAIHDISGSSAYTHGAEVIVGLQRVSKGFSHLHWWKDREGDLGCIGERWDLIHNEEGFHRDPRQLDRQPVRDRVRHALEAHPGMTMDELREETSAKQGTIQRALDDLGAVHDGERRVKDRHFQMPPQLFAVPGGAEVAV